MKRYALLFLFLLLPLRSAWAAFDHAHQAWTNLLAKHVVLIDGGVASQVRYAEFAKDRPALKTYLQSLSLVKAQEFEVWAKPQQLAFLINAYNAFTVEKILTRYPDLKSIKDFGTFFGNPWKDKFFSLLGRPMSLDNVEHDTIRAEGRYEDPRIHFAVNCASIGCPMLREEAYVAQRIDAQLDEQALRFVSDGTRNRYDPRSAKLLVSSIFDWYGKDFARGWKGHASVVQFMARYADRLADDPAHRELIRSGKAPVGFLDYDWALNDTRP